MVVRSRVLCVIVMMAAAAGVTACRSNVGVAATIDGHRVTETTVDDYVTAGAKPVSVSDQSGSGAFEAAPKAIVLQTLIDIRLFDKTLANTSAGKLTASELAAGRTSLLAGKSPAAFMRESHLNGFSRGFADQFIHRQLLYAKLTALQQQGVDVATAYRKVDVSVVVNARYGKWDARGRSLLSGNAFAGVPSFVTLTAPGSG